MNQHDDISEKLSAYLDGELDDQQAAAVERAVAGDAAFAAQLQELRAVRKLLHSMPRTTAPEDFAAQVMDRAQRMHLAKPPAARGDIAIRWVRRSAAAAVLLAFVSICGSVGYNLYKVSKAPRYADTPSVASVDRAKDAQPAAAKPSEALAKSGSGAPGGWNAKELAEDNGLTNLTICTTDLPATRKELEHVLITNGVEIEKQPVRASKGGSNFENFSNNTARVQRARDEEVIYEVEADDSQALNIRNGVNRLQAVQQVGQNIMPMDNTFADKQDQKKNELADSTTNLKLGHQRESKDMPKAAPPATGMPGKAQDGYYLDKAGHTIYQQAGGSGGAPSTRPAQKQSQPMGPAQPAPVQIAQGGRAPANDQKSTAAARQGDVQQAARDDRPAGQVANLPPGQAAQPVRQEQVAQQSPNQIANLRQNSRGNRIIITLQYRPADSPNLSQAVQSQLNFAATQLNATGPASNPAAREASQRAVQDAKQADQAK